MESRPRLSSRFSRQNGQLVRSGFEDCDRTIAFRIIWFIDSSLPLQNQSAKCCSIFLGICVPSVLQTLLMFCLQFAQARRFTFRPMQLVQATEHLYSCLSFLVYIALSWSLQKTKGFNRHQHRICISPPKCLFPKPKS